MRSNVHKSNCLLKTVFQNIEIIATAFKNRILTYRLNPYEVHFETPEAFLYDSMKYIIKLISMTLEKHVCLKVNLELFANFILPHSDQQHLKSFNTKNAVILKDTDLSEMYTEASNTIKQKLTEFEHCETGWSFLSISHLEININKYCPMRGGSYIDLPPKVKNTKSCINIQNNDNHCLLWSVVAALHPRERNACRVSSYPHYSDVLNIKGMTFPPTLNDVRILEKNNPDLSLNIYGLDNKCHVTGPLYKSDSRKLNHVNLLYIEKNGNYHYCLIKDLLRLVRTQISGHRGRMYLCENCLQFFCSVSKYTTHACSEVLSVLPPKNSVLKFDHYERQQKINFVIYADFESILLSCPESDDVNTNTKTIKKHDPSCFGYYICCSHDSSLNKYVSYRGPNCAKVFIEYLVRDVTEIHSIIQTKQTVLKLSKHQQDEYRNESVCHICHNFLFDDKVMDHDHITGEYRGAAHNQCNLLHRVCPFVPVIFHNLSGYDSHLFIKELADYKGDIKIIPRTKEKYLSITKYLTTENSSHSIQIKFLDSFQFLSSSLNNLCKTLHEKDFVHLSQEFKEKEQFELVREKGVYPYDYIDSWSKYNVKNLPEKKDFFNILTNEHISNKDYCRALRIWNIFNIHSLGEYTELYLKSDVLILCDIFENFRNTCLQYYKLDPAYYMSSAALSWDAMLLCTKVQLDLIYDIEIYQLLEKGIRGGLAQCSLRHAKANNKYLPDYNEQKESTFLMYLDCNNLYGHAMTQKMPISEFRFLNDDEINAFDIMHTRDNDDYGYILEVDLKYGDDLHYSHSDLPFASEKFIPPGGKNPKLIANLYDKYNYVIHYVHLKECIKNGLLLTKIHKILIFRQDNYLKKYIDLNTQLRQKSRSTFEKDFFKLLNNAIFGKTIENKRKHVNVKLVSQWSDSNNKTNKIIGAKELIAKPNFHSAAIFSENFAAIQLNHEKVKLDRPIYIGFSVLEYAKTHIYQFHYNYIKKKYGKNVKLCYTDTDSLLYLIHTNDFYEDLKNDLSLYDTSNFKIDNPFNIPVANAKVPGLFKDELGGDVIAEFVGLRAKLYCIKSVNVEIKKAKGISKTITKNLNITDYNETLKKNTNMRCKMNMIKSIKHALYTQEVNKLVLNRNDDKRQILPNQVDTLPWGHCDTVC